METITSSYEGTQPNSTEVMQKYYGWMLCSTISKLWSDNNNCSSYHFCILLNLKSGKFPLCLNLEFVIRYRDTINQLFSKWGMQTPWGSPVANRGVATRGTLLRLPLCLSQLSPGIRRSSSNMRRKWQY